MGTLPPLASGEVEVPYGTELLWRQMTKHIWDETNRKPASTAFGPADADHGMPSFSRANKVSAQDSRDWHQENARSASLAVWPIATSDIAVSKLRIVDDEEAEIPEGEKCAPGHAFIDYRGVLDDKKSQRNLRAILLREALKRQEEQTTDIGFVPLDEREDEAS